MFLFLYLGRRSCMSMYVCMHVYIHTYIRTHKRQTDRQTDRQTHPSLFLFLYLGRRPLRHLAASASAPRSSLYPFRLSSPAAVNSALHVYLCCVLFKCASSEGWRREKFAPVLRFCIHGPRACALSRARTPDPRRKCASVARPSSHLAELENFREI